jgi:hypothetical protein
MARGTERFAGPVSEGVAEAVLVRMGEHDEYLHDEATLSGLPRFGSNGVCEFRVTGASVA